MKKLFKSKLLIQVVVASMVATLATAGIVAAATTVGSNINTTGTLTVTGANTLYGATSIGGALTATSTLAVTGTTTLGGVASSTSAGVGMKLNGLTVYGTATATTLTDGTASLSAGALTGLTTALTAAQGGTGWGTINANTVLLGNGTNKIATTSAGTNGYVLALSGGVPTWVATSTLSTITGTLAVANGGTGSTTLSGILKGNGTGVMATAVADTDYLVPATAAATYSPLASPTFTGTVILPTTTLGGVASSTVTSANSVKLNNLAVYGKVGIASSTPLGNLAIGTAGATSTISMGYFCIAAQTEAGTLYYVRLDPTQVNVFATSTTPCNQ